MKKFGFLVFLLALIGGLIAANSSSFGRIGGSFLNFKVGSEQGSGRVASEIREISDFHGVDVGGVFQVEITAQKGHSVEIEADDNLLPLITTKVRNGILTISTERKLSTENPLRIRISAPDIDSLDVSGTAKVSLVGLQNESISIDSSGASRVRVTGETAKLTTDVSGATQIDAQELQAANANIEASGASRVDVNVTGELRTDASGASKITYSGTPSSLQTKRSGASSVSQR
ncbi:MAG: DUF2807 domain-containing protein [Pyrinomonadaceae bacterium]|nr:DUF2807 domain-containing protein [Pyrinomonadaceae bacterium]